MGLLKSISMLRNLLQRCPYSGVLSHSGRRDASRQFSSTEWNWLKTAFRMPAEFEGSLSVDWFDRWKWHFLFYTSKRFRIALRRVGVLNHFSSWQVDKWIKWCAKITSEFNWFVSSFSIEWHVYVNYIQLHQFIIQKRAQISVYRFASINCSNLDCKQHKLTKLIG